MWRTFFPIDSSADPDEIVELDGVKLYLGSIYSTHQPVLEKFGIKAVVNLSQMSIFSKTDSIDVLDIDIEDYSDANIKQHFECTIAFIEKSFVSKKNILVNCAAGFSRSPSIVIAYLMFKNNWNLEKAFEFVRSRRFVSPNSGFMKQLKEFEEEHQKKQIKN